MRRSIRAVLAVVGLGVLAASCDEGRLVSGPGGVLEAEVEAITGRSSIIAGEDVEFSTAIVLSNGSEVTDAGAVQWSAEPASAVTFPDGTTGYAVTVRGRAPAAKVTLKAEVNHTLLQAETKTRDVEILILGVEATRPADGDTSISAIGDAITLRAHGIADGGESADSGGVTWTHRGSATRVLSHTSRDSLRIEAEAAGTDTFFVARAGQCTGSCADTVVVRVEQQVDSMDVGFSGRSTFTALGQTTQLTAQPFDANGNPTPHTVSWTVADAAVASIDETGLVTAAGNGTTTVTAAAGSFEETLELSVAQVASSITVTPNPPPTTLLGGDTLHLTVTATDSNDHAIQDLAVTWSSEDESTATVDGSTTTTTIVTAQQVASERATWVRADLAGRRDSVQVSVGVATLTTVEVMPGTDTIVALTDTTRLEAAGLNQNGSVMQGQTFTWLSRDNEVATVDSDGLVTAVAPGEIYVIATSDSDPSKLDSALVVVDQRVASVTVSPESHTFNALTHTKQFTATATDSKGVAVSDAEIIWSEGLDATAVISVAGTGLVTADAVGSSHVIATSGGVADSAEVTVQQVPASIVVTPTKDTVTVGATVAFSAIVEDAAGQTIPDASVSWASLNTNFATVDASTGVVTGVSVTGADSVGIQAHPEGFPDLVAMSYVTVEAFVLEFDGDDYASAGDVLDLDSTTRPEGWTIETWVKPGSAAGTQYLLNKGNTDSANNGASYGLYLASGVPTIYVRNKNGGAMDAVQTLEAGASIGTGSWRHVAVSFDNSTFVAKMYVDGDSVASFTFAGAPHNQAGELVVGAQTTAAAAPFTGSLDELRFWRTVRTSAEIAGDYQSTLNGNETGLLAWWPFNAGAGNPVDQSGGITLTLGTTPNDPVWASESPVIP